MRSSFPRLKRVRLEIDPPWRTKKKKKREKKRHDTRGEHYYNDRTLPSYLLAGKGKREVGEEREKEKEK